MYIDDFFWMHERGVDFIFIFSYIHIGRKFFINLFLKENETSWKSGALTFLVIQATVFFGLVLCCTHLSEITLTIGANIIHTIFFFYGKVYWWVLTDKQLNTDTLIRLAYLHYILAFFTFYLAYLHSLDMHYDWKTEFGFDSIAQEISWFSEALLLELFVLFSIIVYFVFFGKINYAEPECISYELFMWGDICKVIDIRFYGVAPHWYFRSFMSWLIVCPHHKIGIYGLIFFFLSIYYQPNIRFKLQKLNIIFYQFFYSNRFEIINNNEFDVFKNNLYIFFYMACIYTTAFLPYGKFFNRLYGNEASLLAYLFIFSFLIFNFFINNTFMSLIKNVDTVN